MTEHPIGSSPERDAYHRGPGHRASTGDITAYVADRTGCSLTAGFAEMLDAGSSIPGGRRISGFMEDYGLGEWKLGVSGSRGLVWRTAAVAGDTCDRVAFLFSFGFGNGSPLPQPSGRWDIFCNDRFALSIRVVNHDQLWRNGPCQLAFTANRNCTAPPYASMTLSSIIRDESVATFGPAILVVPRSWVATGSQAVIRVEPRGEYQSSRWFQLGTGPDPIATDLYGAVNLVAGETRAIGGSNLYFGDIHTHSGQVLEEKENNGCGRGTRRSNYEYARGPGGLDFYTLTEHEWQVDPERIPALFSLADEYEESGKFACIPGYEFTNLNYGHRNIYFRESTGTIINSSTPWGPLTLDPAISTKPEALWNALEAHGTEFMSVPHHPSAASHPFNWNTYHPRYDRLVEVYSSWGSSEYAGDFPRGMTDRFASLYAREALNRGYRLGMIASSDGHDGHPGNAQGTFDAHEYGYHFLGSGRAVVLAPDLSRDSVFSALWNRRCYGTTGVPIALSFTLDGELMGSEIESYAADRRPELEIKCRGAGGIDHVRIVKNGRTVVTDFAHGERDYSLRWCDPEPGGNSDSYYYVRVVQGDRESAWSSPIWTSPTQ